MSKKALKTARNRHKKREKNPSEIPASIRNATNYLMRQLSFMGMSVIVLRSRISKSQYLSADTGKRRHVIRVSDHALRHGKKYDFNVYANTPYEKAIHYLAFIDKFKEMVMEIEGQNLGKFRKNGEFEKVCQEPQ
jgi:hypothetical protein